MRGQATIEFYSYMIFFLLVFSIAILVYFDYSAGRNQIRKTQLIEQVAASYAQPFNLAVRVGPVFHTVYCPQLPAQVKVNRVSFRDGYVILNWSMSEGDRVRYYSYPLLDDRVSYDMSDPKNCLNITYGESGWSITEISR